MVPPLHSAPDLISLEKEAEFKRQFERIQGNILDEHDRDFAVYCLVRFRDGECARATEWLANQVPTIAARQTAEPLFRGVGISLDGYRHLGLETSRFDVHFRSGGLKKHAPGIGDPPVEQWEQFYQGQIHVLVILAHNDRDHLASAANALGSELRGIAGVHVEQGVRFRGAAGPLEHFGYVDGISQPVFFERLLPAATNFWNPQAGPLLVFRRDRLSSIDSDSGSYFVFRKLEQNVRLFHSQLRELAHAIAEAGGDPALAPALPVGRFPDGTALAVSGAPRPCARPENDFTYSASGSETRCPLAAHVRKLNPRTFPLRRIVRRSITYGPPTTEFSRPELLPEGGVGILFQCCQASIADQFEFLQKTWANQPDSPEPGGGYDPIGGAVRAAQCWPVRYGARETIARQFGGAVRMLGGEYFFLPSLGFFEYLSSRLRTARPGSLRSPEGF